VDSLRVSLTQRATRISPLSHSSFLAASPALRVVEGICGVSHSLLPTALALPTAFCPGLLKYPLRRAIPA